MPAAALVPTMADDLARCCATSTGDIPDPAATRRLADVFKALGEPTRLRLLCLVAAQEAGEACICELTEPVGLSQPTVSHHMKTLVDAGLLAREQRGKWAYYRLVPGVLDGIGAALSSVVATRS